MRAGHRYVAYTSDIGESFRPLAHPNLVRAAYGVSWLYLTGDVANEGYKAYLQNQATLHGGHAISSVPEFLRPASEKSPPTSSSPSLSPSSPTTPAKRGPRTIGGDDDDEALYDARVRLHPVGKVPFLEDYRTVMVKRALFQSIASMGLPAFTIHSIVKYSGRALKDHKNKLIRTWAPIGLGLAIVPALPFIFDHPVEFVVERGFDKGYELFSGKKADAVKVKEL